MRKKRLIRVIYTLPFLIPLLLFWIIPLILALIISFTDWDYISSDINFVGLYNYIDIFTDPDFVKALSNTFVFGLGTIFATIVLGLIFALLFQKNFTGRKIYQTIIFSPWVTPTVAVSLVWSWIYDPDKGFANFILKTLGLKPLEWLHSSKTAMLGIIIFTVWKSIGWTMLFYLGALERVPKSTYEAAEIDGGNYLGKFIHVTLPLISPTTYFLFIINLITSIQVYDQIQIMTQGGPGGSTTTLLYLYYEKAFQNFQMGSANAVAIVILTIIILLSFMSSYISKRWVHYE
ncbi:carbohydrate ABC transporter permease [Vallitalea guaymasensis]|uniref:carbohydrate ABC transporter permease n=1 Tax=Vallitalea guaymasensis TaxID=1185412 RepID=UPI001FA87268|nr:sugar ABC transporter permease [Vallitalea guaymasensis]